MTEKIETEDKKGGNVKVGFAANDFPLSNFIEWDLDCKKHFGDCRWIKIWNDHLISKQTNLYSMLIDKISDLEDRLDTVRKQLNDEPEEKKEQVIETLGKGVD